ncbi:hypothetical protein AURDEDRAFT_57521 [Auricularia subglabra TFB-10046 SS5]|nr:hypothetical protein AURDEDRAFT_57521 [Auricularia subglabra TFB-10046 SS5]
MSIFSRLRAPKLQNTGSVARDHLASERTFLAWLRTGLGFVALGIAVERFNTLNLPTVLPDTKDSQRHIHSRDSSDLLVAALLGTGSGSIAYGTARYFSNMRLLQQGLFKPAYLGPGVLGAAVAALAGTMYISAARVAPPSQDER